MTGLDKLVQQVTAMNQGPWFLPNWLRWRRRLRRTIAIWDVKSVQRSPLSKKKLGEL